MSKCLYSAVAYVIPWFDFVNQGCYIPKCSYSKSSNALFCIYSGNVLSQFDHGDVSYRFNRKDDNAMLEFVIVVTLKFNSALLEQSESSWFFLSEQENYGINSKIGKMYAHLPSFRISIENLQTPHIPLPDVVFSSLLLPPSFLPLFHPRYL